MRSADVPIIAFVICAAILCIKNCDPGAKDAEREEKQRQHAVWELQQGHGAIDRSRGQQEVKP
jgi:hypothetical protein